MNSAFRDRVYDIVRNIPAGKVATYGQIAALAGNAKAARAVGMSMKCNPDAKSVPCHRVVAADGSLTGYAFGGITAKKDKLLQEGVTFVGGKVNLGQSQWKS